MKRTIAASIVAVTALTATCAVVSAQHARLFPPEDLGQLEGPDRDAWQRPDQIMDALQIGENSVVADLGAGGGWFTVRLARRVGPNGHVYAEDIQPQMIEAITAHEQVSQTAARARALGLTVVEATCRFREQAGTDGPLFLGRHIIAAALARGHEVTMFNRGRTRTELFPDVDVEILMDIINGPLFYRFFLRGETVSEPVVEAIVDMLLGGIRAPDPYRST